jgi:hypothetical protein
MAERTWKDRLHLNPKPTAKWFSELQDAREILKNPASFTEKQLAAAAKREYEITSKLADMKSPEQKAKNAADHKKYRLNSQAEFQKARQILKTNAKKK